MPTIWRVSKTSNSEMSGTVKDMKQFNNNYYIYLPCHIATGGCVKGNAPFGLSTG
jgi:hypothetical protein